MVCIPAWLAFRTGWDAEVQHYYVQFEWSGIAPGWLHRCIPGPVELPLDGPLLPLCRQWQQAL